MKIIKDNSKKTILKDKTYKIICSECKSKLEYTNNDIESDRDGRFIICPICSKLHPIKDYNDKIRTLNNVLWNFVIKK